MNKMLKTQQGNTEYFCHNKCHKNYRNMFVETRDCTIHIARSWHWTKWFEEIRFAILLWTTQAFLTHDSSAEMEHNWPLHYNPRWVMAFIHLLDFAIICQESIDLDEIILLLRCIVTPQRNSYTPIPGSGELDRLLSMWHCKNLLQGRCHGRISNVFSKFLVHGVIGKLFVYHAVIRDTNLVGPWYGYYGNCSQDPWYLISVKLPHGYLSGITAAPDVERPWGWFRYVTLRSCRSQPSWVDVGSLGEQWRGAPN